MNRLERNADRICLIVPGGESLTYKQVIARADVFAMKLGAARRLVFIEGENTAPSFIAYIGCLRAGHAVHLINREKQDENEALVAAYRPNAVIRCGAEAIIERVHDDAIALHPDLCILLSTSGSTGSKKLVKLSRGNIEANTESIVDYLGMGPDDRAMTSLKFYYSYGMSIINSHLFTGGALVLSDLSVQDHAFWTLFGDHRVTSFSGVPYSFQLLDQMEIDSAAFPSLRLMTQAGGRLAPDLVRTFARMGEKQGWKFFVMYGQTEAAPRMSYLPPELAHDHPDCIGVAIPGGRLDIVDEHGHVLGEGHEGELAYSGPNVMIGYATDSAGLATGETIERLLTGDLAVRLENGLFKIIGRKARFVKPFGLRVNLDDIEIWLDGQGVQAAIVGRDNEILVFTEAAANTELARRLAAKYNLPASMFALKILHPLPRLPNGKVDYRGLETYAWGQGDQRGETRVGFWLRFLRQASREFMGLFTGGAGQWTSVEEIFKVYFPAKALTQDQSFVSLGGDSLLHVEMSICLEEYLGALPPQWHDQSIRELQALSG